MRELCSYRLRDERAFRPRTNPVESARGVARGWKLSRRTTGEPGRRVAERTPVLFEGRNRS